MSSTKDTANEGFQMTSEEDREETDERQGSDNEKKPFVSRLFEECKHFKIIRPLIPLKISLFFFFGAGATVGPFIQIFFKQRGLTISHVSYIYMFNPVVHFLGPAISGVIADKTGRPKIVLIANMVFAFLSLNAMFLIPRTGQTACSNNGVNFTCHSGLAMTAGSQTCQNAWNSSQFLNCSYQCQDNSETKSYPWCSDVDEKSCKIIASNSSVGIHLISIKDENGNNKCLLDESSSIPNAVNLSWCHNNSTQNCNLTCSTDNANSSAPIPCHGNEYDDNFVTVFSMSFVLLLVFATVMSNCYRFLDVTSMSMVKVHNSDFGRERFWSILSVMLISPLAGFIVEQFTLEGEPRNIYVAFYMFDAMLLVAILSVLKLDVEISHPGKRMWRKTLLLLKKPDVLAFATAILVLGTSWGFMKNFSNLYLNTMSAPSILLGLLMSVNSLSGLPFLLTSNWFVRLIGSRKLLVLAFFGYFVYFIGYATLSNPWYALLYELTSILTYHLLWVAVVRHSHEIAPEGITATVIASAGGVHYGIGKGTGSLPGLVLGRKPGPLAFYITAGVSAFSALLYGLFLFARSRTERQSEVPTNVKEDEEEQLRSDPKVEKLSSV